MITIVKSPLADSRSANKPPTESELLNATKMHIKDVRQAMGFIADSLKERAKNHDYTKIENIEAYTDALNSEGIKETEWYKYHTTTERHHLKSHIPENVNLIDVLEHVCDCTMAGLARSGEVYDIDIDPDVLVLAVENTVKILKAHTEVLEDNKDHFDIDNDDSNNILDEVVKD